MHDMTVMSDSGVKKRVAAAAAVQKAPETTKSAKSGESSAESDAGAGSGGGESESSRDRRDRDCAPAPAMRVVGLTSIVLTAVLCGALYFIFKSIGSDGGDGLEELPALDQPMVCVSVHLNDD